VLLVEVEVLLVVVSGGIIVVLLVVVGNVEVEVLVVVPPLHASQFSNVEVTVTLVPLIPVGDTVQHALVSNGAPGAKNLYTAAELKDILVVIVNELPPAQLLIK
jgi:hypothetical protein